MVNRPSTLPVRVVVTGTAYRRASPTTGSSPMSPMPYLHDRSTVADAEGLIREHGCGAAAQAAKRAHRSRGLGNHIHFCRWRQVARLINFLSEQRVSGSIH
jgi:hypothetical protein